VLAEDPQMLAEAGHLALENGPLAAGIEHPGKEQPREFLRHRCGRKRDIGGP
jgi:hypothetical protein